MSLETEIAALTASNNKMAEYFLGKKEAIDKAVSSAVAAAPAISRTFYVDPKLGDDAGLGSSASPFKTLAAAIAATPAGGRCEAWLQQDYTLAEHLYLLGRRLSLRAEANSGRKLILNEFMPSSGQGLRMGCFWQSDGSTLDFAQMTISLPASSAGDLDTYYCLAFGSGASSPVLHQMRFYNCVFELRGTFRGRLFGPNAALYALAVSGTSIPSALAGSIIPGVAAGTDSKTLANIITNVPTL